MARTKKPESLEEQLQKVEDNIKMMQENLKRLKKSKKELEEKIRINRLEKLDEMIGSSGKSYDEVEQLLSK